MGSLPVLKVLSHISVRKFLAIIVFYTFLWVCGFILCFNSILRISVSMFLAITVFLHISVSNWVCSLFLQYFNTFL